MGHRRCPSSCCERSVTGRGAEAAIHHLARPALRLELSARSAEPRGLKDKGGQCFPERMPPWGERGKERMTRNGENTHAQDSYSHRLLPVKLPSTRLSWLRGQKGGKGEQRPGLAAPGARGSRWPRSPKPSERASVCGRARGGQGSRRGAGGSAQPEAGALAPRAPSRGRREPGLPGEPGFVGHAGSLRPQN